MADKRPIIQYIMGKLNTIDLSDIVDPDDIGEVISAMSLRKSKDYRIVTEGTSDFTLVGSSDSNPGTIFTCNSTINRNGTGTVEEVHPIFLKNNPFIPNVFGFFDGGQIKTLLEIDEVPQDQLEPRRYILVDISEAELEKENIFEAFVEDNPSDFSLKSWLGTIGVNLFVYAEDLDIYSIVYERVQTMWDIQFKDSLELVSGLVDDELRSVSMTSPKVIDGDEIIELNRYNYKEMFFPINFVITNKGIIQASRQRIIYRVSDEGVQPEIWEEVGLSTAPKDFKWTRIYEDITKSGESVTTIHFNNDAFCYSRK